MIKKVLSLLLTAAMLISCCCYVTAAGTEGTFSSLSELGNFAQNKTVDVLGNIEVKTANGSYADSVVASRGESISAKATIDMSDVIRTVNRAKNALANDALRAELAGKAVTGTFTIIAEWTDGVYILPANIENGNLDGFTFVPAAGKTAAAAKALFVEESRVKSTNKITITIKVADDVKVSDLENLPEKIYVEYTGFGISANSTLSGTITGNTVIADAGTIEYSFVDADDTTKAIQPASLKIKSSTGGSVSGSGSETTTTTNPDGSSTTIETDKKTGTTTETTTRPDGSSTVVETEKNGTTTTTDKDAAGNTTTTVETPEGDKTTTETKTDGSQKVVEEKADGTTTTTDKDAAGNTTTTVETPEGDKTTTETKTDGSQKVVEEKADGTTTTTEKDTQGNTSTTVETSDGNVSTEHTSTDGTVIKTETPKNGNTTAEITISSKQETNIKIPVEKINSITDVIVTDKEGNETIVKDYIENEEEKTVEITLSDDAKVDINIKFKEFEDIHPVSYWAEGAVDFVYANDLMNGVSTTHFEPDWSITRGMFVTILYRLESEPDVELDYTYKDIEKDSYYEKAVAWGAKNIIIKGYDEDNYAPYEIITREQMAAIIYRYINYIGALNLANEETENNAYIDRSLISDYAKEAIEWNSEKGFFKGYEDGSFRPQDDATRAEAATIFKRILKALR